MTRTIDLDLLERVKRLAPGFYTERDSGDWYIITPYGERIGEDFVSRDDARRLLCWLAGDERPKGWTLTPCGNGGLAYDLAIPGQPRATLWTREVKKHFPNALERLPIKEG